MARKSAKFQADKSVDKRTRSSVKSLTDKLTKLFKPKDIAKSLGMSVQKWTSTKKQIQQGKIYSPQVRDILKKEVNKTSSRPLNKVIEKTTGQSVKKLSRTQERELKRYLKDQGLDPKEFKKQSKKLLRDIAREEKLNNEIKIGKRKYKNQHLEYVYYGNLEKLQNRVRHARSIKRLPTLEQAVEWWKKIGGGAEYFAIARDRGPSGQDLYHVVETRTHRELSKKNKGNIGGVSHALQILRDQIGDR